MIYVHLEYSHLNTFINLFDYSPKYIDNYLIIHLCIIHLFNLTFIKLFNLYSGI